MLALPLLPELATPLLAPVVPKPEVDVEGYDDNDEEDPEEDPLDLEGDDMDHKEEQPAEDQPEEEADDDDELFPDDYDAEMEIGDDALPPDELEEDLIEDAEEEKIQMTSYYCIRKTRIRTRTHRLCYLRV